MKTLFVISLFSMFLTGCAAFQNPDNQAICDMACDTITELADCSEWGKKPEWRRYRDLAEDSACPVICGEMVLRRPDLLPVLKYISRMEQCNSISWAPEHPDATDTI